MAKLPLTVRSDYVNWTLWQAVRELLQNAKDAQEADGADMDVDYYPRSERLEIVSRGVTIDRSRLILGSTSKRGDNRQRGEFGEGFKLAFATLCRLDRDVTMDVGKERWRPTIGQSDDFDGEEVIIINTRKLQKERNHIRVEIDPVSPDEWETICDRTSFLGSTPEVIETAAGDILLEEPGKIFQKGLFVDSISDLKWGYDLPDVKIDRDRSMVRAYDAKDKIREIIDRAVRDGTLEVEEVYTIIKENRHLEARAMEEHFAYGDDPLSEGVAGLFKEEHGQKAVPVTSTSQTKEAEHYGLHGVPVNRPLNHVLTRAGLGFKEQVNDRNTLIDRWYGASDLPQQHWDQVVRMVGHIAAVDEMPHFEWSVVDFADPGINGEARDGEILLSHDLLEDPPKLLAVMAHEVAHLDGAPDFSVAHRNATEILLATIALEGM